MEDNKDYIFVALEKSHTGFGKLARLTDPYEYTHITYSGEPDMKYFISFSRVKHYAPFSSGFSEETLDCFAYGKNETVKLKIFKIPVSADNKEHINQFIEYVRADRKNYYFNLFSAVSMPIFHGFRIYKTYNCMSFVGRILEMTGNFTMEKAYYKYSIEELDKMMSDFCIEEREFRREEILTPDYMDSVNIFYNIGTLIRMLTILTWRLIFRNPDKDDFKLTE